MLGATRQVRLSYTELHQLKWLLGNLLTLIGMWSLYQLSLGSQSLLYLFSFGLIVLLSSPRLAGVIMQWLGKALAPAVVLLVVIDFSLNYIELIEPMTRMVLLLSFLRALQYRSRREDLQLLLLALFMLILTGVLTVSLLFAMQIILFSPLAMGLLFIVNLLESKPKHVLTLEDWTDFHWGQFITRIGSGLDFRMLLLAGALFTSVVTVSSFIFVLLPRFSMGQSLSFVQLQASGKKGFSDKIQFGDVNELSDDNAIALRVEPPGRDRVPMTPYWRMIVLDEYRNGSFSLSMTARTTSLQTQVTNIYDARFGRLQSKGEVNEAPWVFYLEGGVSRFLPFMGSFDTIRFPKKTKFNAFPILNLIELNQVSSNVFGYSVEGMLIDEAIPASQMEVRALQGASPVIPTFDNSGKMLRVNYPMTTLMLPPNRNDRAYLESVVEEITGGEQLDFNTFQQRAFSYLHTRFQYDTSLGSFSNQGASDPLISWMREAETGWCEHFAGSFILLARTAGFPARAVAGFTGATWNDFENYLVVRNNHAHAWVEVFDVETHYWRRVDPTPHGFGEGGQAGSSLASRVETDSGLNAWLDSMRMVWYRRVVNFDQTDQEEMAKGLREFGESFFWEIKKTLLGYWSALKAWLDRGWDFRKIIQVLGIIAVIVFVVVACKYLNRGILFFWKIRYRRGSRSGVLHPTRRQAGKWLLRLRPLRSVVETNRANSCSKVEIDEVYERLLALRYGAMVDSVDSQSLFKQAKRVLKKYREELA